jgi:dsRNA-specific ribonuclease
VRLNTFITYTLFYFQIFAATEWGCAMEEENNVERLARTIKYYFHDHSLVKQVFSHPGICSENRNSFERLEFLGDKTLDFILSAYLYETYPQKNEGWLTQTLSNLVSNDSNARIADKLNLLSFCTINPVHSKNREGLKKIKADTCEALIGAIYTDGGEVPARKFILTHWQIPQPIQTGLETDDFPLTKSKKQQEQREISLNPGNLGTSKDIKEVSPIRQAPKIRYSPDDPNRLNEFCKEYKLPNYEYVFHTSNSPFKVQVCFNGKPLTPIIEGTTEFQAKARSASLVLEIFRQHNAPALFACKNKEQNKMMMSRFLCAYFEPVGPNNKLEIRCDRLD